MSCTLGNDEKGMQGMGPNAENFETNFLQQ